MNCWVSVDHCDLSAADFTQSAIGADSPLHQTSSKAAVLPSQLIDSTDMFKSLTQQPSTVGKGGGQQPTTAADKKSAWFSMFAELDPLAQSADDMGGAA